MRKETVKQQARGTQRDKQRDIKTNKQKDRKRLKVDAKWPLPISG